MRVKFRPSGKMVFLFSLIVELAVIFLMSGSSSSAQETKHENQAQSQPAASAQYAGKEECASCHEEEVNALAKTPHGQKGFEMRSSLACEQCHGPGRAHIDSGGDVTLIHNPGKLKPEESTAICLTCHENGMQVHWKGSVHQQRGLACVTCHSVHHPKSDEFQLKTTTVTETCNGCHMEVKAAIQRTSHHPIREGLMTCASCHNPHGTMTPKMIQASSVNEQCYGCHTEKRGPFLWAHPPVQESCLNCHLPHGSNHEKLLVQNRPWLCQSCHLDTRHPGTLYDGTNVLTSNRELSRSCSNCHFAIHGSNHPSGRVFTR